MCFWPCSVRVFFIWKVKYITWSCRAFYPETIYKDVLLSYVGLRRSDSCFCCTSFVDVWLMSGLKVRFSPLGVSLVFLMMFLYGWWWWCGWWIAECCCCSVFGGLNPWAQQIKILILIPIYTCQRDTMETGKIFFNFHPLCERSK